MTYEPPRVLGIDPGAQGGLAMLEGMRFVRSLRTPRRNVGGKYTVDAQVIDFWLRDLDIPDAVVIEKGIPMPHQNSVATFSTGKNIGVLDALAQLWGAPTFWVAAKTWKAHFKLTGNKRESLTLASELFPKADVNWRIMPNNGVAEAALIALWWVQKNGGTK